MEIVECSRNDPHGLKYCGPAVLAVYKVAKASQSSLRFKSVGADQIQLMLRREVSTGPFCSKGHVRILFKLINPYGHGANGERFDRKTLLWFRKRYPEDAHLTDGLALFICTCIWWVEEQGRRSIYPSLSPLCSSDFDTKLETFGFMAGERNTLLRVLRFTPNERY